MLLSRSREHPLPHLGHSIIIADAGLRSLLANGLVDFPHGFFVQAESLREPEQAAQLGGGLVGRLGYRPTGPRSCAL